MDGRQGQRPDQAGRRHHARHAAQPEPHRRARVVAATGDEARAGHRHQEGAGAHHDREGGGRHQAQQADQDQARGVQADAEGHERPQQEVAAHADPEPRAGQLQGFAPQALQQAQPLEQHQSGRRQQRQGHADLDLAPRPVRDQPRPEPGAQHRCRDHQHQGQGVDLHDGHVDQSLHHRRQRVPGVERARDELVLRPRSL